MWQNSDSLTLVAAWVATQSSLLIKKKKKSLIHIPQPGTNNLSSVWEFLQEPGKCISLMGIATSGSSWKTLMKPGEETGGSGSCWVVTSTLHPWAVGALQSLAQHGDQQEHPGEDEGHQTYWISILPSCQWTCWVGKDTPWPLGGSSLSWEGFFRGKQREAGWVSAVTRWNTTAQGNSGSCARSSHHSSAQLYKMGCKLCSFWLAATIKVMCALQHYEFDGGMSPETSPCTRS